MELKVEDNFEEEDLGFDDSESIEADISKENLPIIFNTVSKLLYKDAISSIVREITSNAFDSHREANVTTPVEINFDHNDKGYYFTFTDFGIGLSPDRIKTIYMNYFSSTKRSSNNEIGGFGLGSKTPLAYTDIFYITTIFDSIHYEYVMSINGGKPKIELLSTKSTDQHNGTTIKIYMLDFSDVAKFTKAAKTQLAYFYNIVFKEFDAVNEIGNYLPSNNYIIYEHELFSYRTVDNLFDTMHLCIGPVAYPIRWEELGIAPVKLPIAIKFNIGELQPVPSREDIQYFDDVNGKKGSKSLIIDKVNEVVNYLVTSYNNSITNITTFKDYLARRNSSQQIELAKDIFLDVSSLIKNNEKIQTNFEPLKEYPVQIPTNWAFIFKPVAYVGRQKFYVGEEQLKKVGNIDIYSPNVEVFYLHKNQELVLGKIRKAYLRDRVNTNYKPIVFVRANTSYFDYYHKLKVKRDKNIKSMLYYKRYPNEWRYLSEERKQEIINNEKIKHFIGAVPLFKKYKELALTEYLNDYVSDYALSEPTVEYLKHYREKYDVGGAIKQRKIDKKILLQVRTETNWTKYETKISDIQSMTGMFIYGFKDDKDNLQTARIILGLRNYPSCYPYSTHKIFICCQTIAANEPYFYRMKNAIHVNQFLATPNKILKGYITGLLVHEKFESLKRTGNYKLLNKLSIDYASKFEKIESFLDSTYKVRYYTNLHESITTPLKELFITNGWIHKDIIDDLNWLSQFEGNLPLLEYLQLSDNNLFNNRPEKLIKEMAEYAKKVNGLTAQINRQFYLLEESPIVVEIRRKKELKMLYDSIQNTIFDKSKKILMLQEHAESLQVSEPIECTVEEEIFEEI
jgi:hypothetical protein